MAEKMTPAFIHILLCDNDYGWELGIVAKHVHECFFNPQILCSERAIKDAVITLMLGLGSLMHASRGFSAPGNTHRYLEQRLTVKFADAPPDLDHDGGSVAIDRNTGYIWRF